MSRTDVTGTTATRFSVPTGDGLALAARSYGDPAAPTVLCVHGYPDDSSVWEGVVADLAADHHVVVYDVRGAGASPAPRERSGYALDRLADDLARVAAAASPDRPVHLLAHDWGSLAAWHTVTEERHARLFASYTSVSGPCLDHAAHWLRSRLRPSPRALAEVADEALRSAYIGFFHLPWAPEFAWLTGIGGAAMRALERVGPPKGRPPRERRLLRNQLNGLELYRVNMRDRLLRPQERRTSVPVQLLAPTHELFMLESAQSSAAQWCEDFRFHRVAGGHWIPRSRPGVVAGRVRELVADTEEERAPGRGPLAVVTGAGSGIGRATALELAARGTRVVCADIDGGAAERTAEQAARTGPGAAAYQVDVADTAAVEEFAKRVRAEHGVPDTGNNNAGIGVGGTFLDTAPDDWRRAIDVNLWGVVNGCRAFAPMMIEEGVGGRILNTASAAAYLPSRAYPAYASTKSAVLMLSRCLRGELAEHGIRVTAVCPGLVNTNIISTTTFSGAGSASSTRDRLNRLYRRRGFTPERAAREIADAVDRAPEVLPVTSEARAGLALSRLAPAALRAAARLSPLS
ncbi:SDR family oxidoreductase [Nocardiopsis suaedae]|uniref:SDR family oxidoreductase n=1 Tax=Nocardiopsis suaedae TaxID=3018444 RepID=A0ABT4TP33_9ACTN|nr:SDR family oxidoreductase [Nocardiopsis suaedae]MDA2806438.1 SDR family oxidoreductase [Nocardiopsis suaedae]